MEKSLREKLGKELLFFDGAMGTELQNRGPVSYTHLDVYKRQGKSSPELLATEAPCKPRLVQD